MEQMQNRSALNACPFYSLKLYDLYGYHNLPGTRYSWNYRWIAFSHQSGGV